MLNIGFRQYSTAAKYIQAVKKQTKHKEWLGIKDEIIHFANTLVKQPAYILWLNRNKKRWNDVYKNCHYPQTIKLIKLLQKYNTLKTLVFINNLLENEDSFVLVEHAKQQPQAESELRKTVSHVWGVKESPDLRYKPNPSLLGGVRLTYRNQSFDMSYRAKRHNLVLQLRKKISS